MSLLSVRKYLPLLKCLLSTHKGFFLYFLLVGKVSALFAFSFWDETAGGDGDEWVNRKLLRFAADTISCLLWIPGPSML